MNERTKQILADHEAGMRPKQLAEKYNRSISRISHILKDNMADTQELKVDKRKLFEEIGSTGLTRWGGQISEEFLRELQGDKGRKIFREMRENNPVVNAVTFAIEMSMRQVKWFAEPTSDGDHETSDLIDQCLEDMAYTWSDTLAQIMTMLEYGWSYFELIYKVRRGRDVREGQAESNYDDGYVGWRKWLPIAQDTLLIGDEWIFDDAGGIQGCNQSPPPDYITRPIPIEKALHFRTTIAKNNPEGRSLYRGMYQPWYMSKNMAEIEAIAAERMGTGIPVAYLGDDCSKSGAKSDLELAKTMVRDVRADEHSGVVIPHPKMGAGAGEGKGMLFELLSPPSRGIVDFDTVINRYDKRIALAGLAQFIMLGQEQVGSFALSKDQSDIFVMALGTWAESIAQVISRYGIPRLLKLTPKFSKLKEYPKLSHSEVGAPDLQGLATYINALVGSQVLTPDPNLEKYLREAAHLPERQEPIQVQPIIDPTEDTELTDAETQDKTVIDDNEPNSGTEEAQKEMGSEKFTLTQSRRAVGGARYETATNQYQSELETLYTDWYGSLVKKLNGEEDEQKRDDTLVTALAAFGAAMQQLGRRRLMEAMLLGAAGNPLTSEGLDALAQSVAENDAYIENSLSPAIRDKVRNAYRDDPLLATSDAAVNGVFATITPRVSSYAGAYWTTLHKGIGDAVMQSPEADNLAVRVKLDPAAKHCTRCPPLAKVYRNWAEFMAESGLPGAPGRSECGANCRCLTEIETAPGSGAFERLSARSNDADFFEDEGRWITVNGAHVLIAGDEKPGWASDTGQIVEGEQVYRGKFLNKNKYAVHDPDYPSAPFADTPQEAVKQYRTSKSAYEQSSKESRERKQKIGAMAEDLRKGVQLPEHRKLFGNGKEAMTRQSARGALRELGLRYTDAEDILRGISPSFVNADGKAFYDTERILGKARDWMQKAS